ncbi:hypothetical protein [Dyella silvatica]|uniref:hypothetical protein n=1 Tax=Dyella silvatica TaxID=2992128 RepID=UPI002253CC1F|nr:hypothetical protein [Dyella silvatica]
MKDVFFGLGLQYDEGVQSKIALNAACIAVEVHKSEHFDTLYYRIGQCERLSVQWQPSQKYDSGITPAVALNTEGLLVEVHKSEHFDHLYSRIGSIKGDAIEWGSSSKYDGGITPQVALNDRGDVVEVHQSGWNTGLWCRVGRLEHQTLRWSASQNYDTGRKPAVAMQRDGTVVAVHQSAADDGKLLYRVGRINGTRIDWGYPTHYDNGINPGVALTDDGFVIAVHQSDSTLGRATQQRCGRIHGSSIDWVGPSRHYDDGAAPAVATNGSIAIQTRQSENADTLWYSAALVTDRASWMQDRLDQLGARTLRTLILPAAHDAAMYTSGGWETLGKTQDLSLFEQLANGIRYFDLRPGWDGSSFYLYNGPIKGPPMAMVLEDIRHFMSRGHRELVLLKLSHFHGLNAELYRKMIQQIKTAIGSWLFTALPTGKRLADLTLRDYTASSGRVLVLCDEQYPLNQPEPGIWVYRDSQANDVARGDLRVFDQYSNSMSYTTMKVDQLKKLEHYNGKCLSAPSLPCDLFLLSWTLTPPTGVWLVSKEANRNLAGVIAGIKPNNHGYLPGLLCVDYVEYARATDIAITRQLSLSPQIQEVDLLAYS